MNYKYIFKAVAVSTVSAFFCIGCGGGDDGGGGEKPVDPNNPNNGGGGGSNCSANFRTIKIGTQTWMAENLNCNLEGSKCHENSADSCAKYGRLYNWEDAKKACPAGWHLPDTTEWNTLVDFAGGLETAGKKLQATSGWYDNDNGTDDYGFAALPGSFGDSRGGFGPAGHDGYWWSATEYSAYDAWGLYMSRNFDAVVLDGIFKTSFLSIRCVAD